MLSPEAAKAQEQAWARQQARQSLFDAGPYLANDGATIVIPSPYRHEAFSQVLRAYGFTFDYSALGCAWLRSTSAPHAGRRYTPQGWLAWAKTHYAKAWGWTDEGSKSND